MQILCQERGYQADPMARRLVIGSGSFFREQCFRVGFLTQNVLPALKIVPIHRFPGSDISFHEKGYEFLFPVVEVVAPASAIVIVQADAQFFAVP